MSVTSKGVARIVSLVLLLTAVPGHGEIFMWNDERGTAHYTNRQDDIPLRFRAGAKSLNYDQAQQAGSLPPQTADQLQSTRPDAVKQKGEERGGEVKSRSGNRQ